MSQSINISGASATGRAPESEYETSVRRLIDSITDLPTIPVVASKVNQLLSSPTSSANDLARVISSDPSISAKVLRVVNSSFYSLSNKVTSISQAIVILGYRALRELVLGVSVFSAFGRTTRHKDFDPDAFWRHSLTVGATAKCLARRLRLPGEAEIYFTAGLLHDTGKIVLANHMTAAFDRVAALIAAEKISFVEAERSAYGTDHAFLGSVLFEKWGLDDNLIRGTRYHHAPNELPGGGEALIMPSLIHCADALARLMFPDEMLVQRLPELYPEAFACLEAKGLQYGELSQVMTGSHMEYTASKVFLGLQESA